MSNLLLEVDEAMRWERIEKFWKTYGNYVLALIVMIILATAVTSAWNAWNTHVRTKDTEHLLALMDDEHFPDNITPEALHMRAPLRGIALINAAGSYYQADKTEQALKLYSQAADDRSIPPELRGLALLMQVRMLSADPKSTEDLVGKLQPLLKDRKNPWHEYALLEAASFADSRGPGYAKAREYLEEILANKDAQPSLRVKADALNRLYTAKEGPKP